MQCCTWPPVDQILLRRKRGQKSEAPELAAEDLEAYLDGLVPNQTGASGEEKF